MDSTAAEDARDAKRARLNPPAGGDAAADLISGLDDDVLLRVLGLLGDARDAVRTGALSRRWRGLWTRAPALRFATYRPEFRLPGGAQALRWYAASVNDVLARRTRSGCAIETLSILYATGGPEHSLGLEQPAAPSFVESAQAALMEALPYYDTEYNLNQLMPACADAAQGWIRRAFRHGVKNFALDLCLPLGRPNIWRECYDNWDEQPVVLLDELPSPVRLEAMRLALGGARLWLPTAMKFASLTDLSLERIRIAAGSAHLLGSLVSSASCPRLQKLRMRKIYLVSFHEEMQIEADVLSELWMEDIKVLLSLKLRTPRLQVLHIYRCPHWMLRVSAPRLEELAISFQLELGYPDYPPMWLEVDGGLPCVRSLKFCLWSHRSRLDGYREAENDTSIVLLKHCSSLTCLQVILQGPKVFKEDVDIIKRRVPYLPHIISLTINISLSFIRPHDYGASVASLLTRFRNLRRLSLHLPFFLDMYYSLPEGLDILCNHRYHWKNKEISMAHLQEVELTGLTGTDCELWLMRTLLARAERLHKVAISFNPYCRQHHSKMDAFEHMLLGGGMLTSHRDTHMLTCRGSGLRGRHRRRWL